VLNFVGCLYILDQINVWKLEHFKIIHNITVVVTVVTVIANVVTVIVTLVTGVVLLLL
jgi:hypothetical protein